MPTFNVNQDIQKFLKDTHHYDGPIDGKMGPGTHTAISDMLKSLKIETTKWSKERKLTAAEQLLYKNQKIEVGKIDGLVGPSLLHAREVYEAKLVTTWRDKAEEIALDTPPKPTIKIKVVSSSVWPRQSECTSFYGKVGTRQSKCNLPFPMKLAWDKSSTLKSFSCHEKVADAMERVWQNVFDHYGYEKIKELRLDLFGGCLNVRKMRGGSAWSMHSWGIAIDIDPDRNALKTSWKNSQMSKPEYKKYHEFFYNEGAINLGIERDYDAMHTQFARL
jgi:D-alanyl-D-alanine carboxypeptidase